MGWLGSYAFRVEQKTGSEIARVSSIVHQTLENL